MYLEVKDFDALNGNFPREFSPFWDICPPMSPSRDPLRNFCHPFRQLNTSWTRNYTQVVGPVREGVLLFCLGREGRGATVWGVWID